MLTNIKLWIAACKELNINYEILHPSQNLMRIKLDKYYYFVNYCPPFNSQAVAHIFKDKAYTYQLLHHQIKTPQTVSFLSPFCEEKYKEYLQFQNIEEITHQIINKFQLPVIVKRNQGSTGNNVFVCHSQDEVKSSLETIFDFNHKNYDYIALAQEYVEIKNEYRAVIFNNKLILLYEKDKSNAKFAGNLSPLHWEGSEAKYINNATLIKAIEDFIQPIFQEIEVKYAGLDIAIDKNGEFWLIEINSHPNYEIFVRDNGEEIIINIFKDILNNLRDSVS